MYDQIKQEMEAVTSLSFITQLCLDKVRLCWLLVYVKVSLQCCVENSAAACLVMTMRLGGRLEETHKRRGGMASATMSNPLGSCLVVCEGSDRKLRRQLTVWYIFLMK